MRDSHRLAGSATPGRPGTRAGARSRVVAVAIVLLIVLAGCGRDGSATVQPGGTGLATGGPVSDVAKLCDLLGPGDFEAVGITGTGTPTASSDGPGSASCAYTAAGAANGGVELEVFVGDDPEGAYEAILSGLGSVAPTDIPGVDEAVAGDGIAGVPDQPAAVVVRKGNLVFTIATPGGPNNSLLLEQLAAVVLVRGAALAG